MSPAQVSFGGDSDSEVSAPQDLKRESGRWRCATSTRLSSFFGRALSDGIDPIRKSKLYILQGIEALTSKARTWPEVIREIFRSAATFDAELTLGGLL